MSGINVSGNKDPTLIMNSGFSSQSKGSVSKIGTQDQPIPKAKDTRM